MVTVGQLTISGSVKAKVLLIRPVSKNLRDFARLPKAYNRGFEPRTSNLYYRYLRHSINKLEKKITKLPMVNPPLNFPDLAGYGV